MAMILEVRDRRGAATWHRLDGGAVRIGRAFSSDVILDDPYADAAHATIEPGSDGAYVVTDLGSTNGTFADGARLTAAQVLKPGAELRIGRTTLRLRDANEAVPPAVAETAQRLPRAAHWALTPRGGLAVLAIIAIVSGLIGWSSSTDMSTSGDTIGAALAGLFAVSVWAGFWGLMTRGTERRLRFRAHLVVISLAYLIIAASVILSGWLMFYFPGAWLVGEFFGLVIVVALAGTVVGHLSVAGSLTARGRLYAGIGICLGIAGMIVLGTLVNDEKFSDVPKFSSILKPVPGGVVPAIPVDEFGGALTDLREKVDKAAAKAQ
jgi:pSer/pThr/pTyr-binding forkhead associated (FHA) protein